MTKNLVHIQSLSKPMTIDTELFKKQRQWLYKQPYSPEAEGIIGMLDFILDEIGKLPGPFTNRVIQINVEGGLVQDVFNLPDGWTFEIHDYDMEGAEEWHDIDVDDNGDRFIRS